jgi:hypothetical protein
MRKPGYVSEWGTVAMRKEGEIKHFLEPSMPILHIYNLSWQRRAIHCTKSTID